MQIADTTYKPISYQGHGMIEKASSFNAVAHVINHERRHLDHYRSIARWGGKDVISENITVSYQFVDGKLIPVSGRAEAVIADKENPQSLEINIPESEAADNNQFESANNDFKQNNSEDKVTQLENKLENKLQQLEQKITELEEESSGNLQKVNLESKKRQIEQVISKVKSIKSKNDMEELGALQDQLLDKMEEALMSPEKILEAIMGVKTNQNESKEDNPSPKNAQSLERNYNRSTTLLSKL